MGYAQILPVLPEVRMVILGNLEHENRNHWIKVQHGGSLVIRFLLSFGIRSELQHRQGRVRTFRPHRHLARVPVKAALITFCGGVVFPRRSNSVLLKRRLWGDLPFCSQVVACVGMNFRRQVPVCRNVT